MLYIVLMRTGGKRHRHHRVIILAAAIWISALSFPPSAEAQDEGGFTELSGPKISGGGTSPSLFKESLIRTETSARLSGWNPDSRTGTISVDYVFPKGYHQIDNNEVFTIIPESFPGLIFGSVMKGKPIWKDGSAEYHDETTLVIEFQAGDEIQEGELTVKALSQICDEKGTCLFPESQSHSIFFNPASSPVEPDEKTVSVLNWVSETGMQGISAAENMPGERNAPGTSEAAPNGDHIADGGGVRSALWMFLLMAFAGGILLNIMPCVLPLLSVKALGLLRQAGEDRKSIWKHSWLYVAGIIASFWILAAVIVALQASGRLLGWGFQFQSPTFLLMMIAVIWIFALSLFDVFIIEPPRKGLEGASAAGSRGGYLGSFLTGIFAVLVATPCTAPLLGPALGFAFSQPPLVIFAVFGVTGLGLGLPFLLLGIWPTVLKRLPKPGNWMTTFKEIMGFLLLGTAVYLFTTFLKLSPGSGAGALWWLLFLGLASWLFGKARRPTSKKAFRITGQIAALIIAVLSGILLIEIPQETSPRPSPLIGESDRVMPFNEDDVLRRIAGNEPVFLEFTASWCTTCKINRHVLNDPDVRSIMAEKGLAYIKGDLTAYNETLIRWLGEFGRAGVPLYVLYIPGEDPFIFPELLGKESFIRKLESIKGP